MSSVNLLLDLLRKKRGYLHSNMQPIRNFLIVIFFLLDFFFSIFSSRRRLTIRTLKIMQLRRTLKITWLRTSRIAKLRICGFEFKNPETSLRTCGCGLRKLKIVCGVADLTWGAQRC